MLVRKLVGLVLSAALVFPFVGCGNGDAGAPATPEVPATMPGDDDAGDADTDTDAFDSDWDDDTTTGN
jgi:hypothetical protein